MIERKYGKIISIASVGGQSGSAGNMWSIYGAMKAAVISLSRNLAWELGRYGINVNVVCPGWTVLDKMEDAGEGSGWKQGVAEIYPPEVLERTTKHLAIRRVGRPGDVATTVVFLASDCASYLTGQTISVSGGATMW